MKDNLISILETVCPNEVYLQGTLNPDEAYPSDFITFWTNYADDRAHYDDDTTSYVWNFSVIFYSNNPDHIATYPSTIRTALKNAGFIPQGKGRDIPSDVQSHTGWAMDFLIVE